MSHSDFYEEDEPLDDVKRAFERGSRESRECRECRQRKGHKVDCSLGRTVRYMPDPGERTGRCCGHPLTVKGEQNTSYYWECSEKCNCLILGCVPDYD